MNDTIRAIPGQLTDGLALWSGTALYGCVTVEGDDAGPYFQLKWPGLSSGERLLWRVLAYLNGANDCPTDADLRAGLDDLNYAAVVAVFGISA